MSLCQFEDYDRANHLWLFHLLAFFPECTLVKQGGCFFNLLSNVGLFFKSGGFIDTVCSTEFFGLGTL